MMPRAESAMQAPAAGESGPRMPRRVSVVGNCGSGKTTFARQLARRLGCAHIELDAIHWGPDWTPLPTESFRQQVASRLEAESWVVDGNYHLVRDLVWERADAVAWLDYSLAIILGRLALRTIRRVSRREVLWNGNRERLSNHLFRRDSLFLWALQTHRRRKIEFVEWLNRPAYAHLMRVQLRTPRQTTKWLETNGMTGHSGAPE
jgi:adenylate kinase family enzyme